MKNMHLSIRDTRIEKNQGQGQSTTIHKCKIAKNFAAMQNSNSIELIHVNFLSLLKT